MVVSVMCGKNVVCVVLMFVCVVCSLCLVVIMFGCCVSSDDGRFGVSDGVIVLLLRVSGVLVSVGVVLMSNVSVLVVDVCVCCNWMLSDLVCCSRIFDCVRFSCEIVLVV